MTRKQTKPAADAAAATDDLKPQTPGGDDTAPTTEPALQVKEPGAIDGIEMAKLEALAAGSVGDLAEAIDSLGDDELAELATIEKLGRARTTALGAIAREQNRRKVDAEHPADDREVTGAAPLGDQATYAHMHARDVDPKKLERPVLTRDGWVLPIPRAEGQG